VPSVLLQSIALQQYIERQTFHAGISRVGREVKAPLGGLPSERQI
jgi:hypothetical protein